MKYSKQCTHLNWLVCITFMWCQPANISATSYTEWGIMQIFVLGTQKYFLGGTSLLFTYISVVILDSWLHLGNLTLKKISNFIITVFWSQNKWKVSANVSNKYLNKGMQEFQVHVALNVINYLYFLTTTCLFNFSSSLHMFQFPSIHENMYKKPQPGSDKNWYKGSILSIWNQQTSHFHCPAHDFPYIWCNNCSVVTWQLLSWWSYKMSFNDAVSHFHW